MNKTTEADSYYNNLETMSVQELLMNMNKEDKTVPLAVENAIPQIEKGEFREDLFHRLSVIPIQVPSLNDRKEDIPLLADHFINMICTDYGMPMKTISKDALKALQQKDWTGDIREFRNVIERLIILCGKEITDKDVKQFA